MENMTKRYVDCGNEIFALGKYTTQQADAIIRKYSLSNNYNWTLKQLGYIKWKSHGVYEPVKNIMTYQMADKMIEFIRNYAANHKSKNKNSVVKRKVKEQKPLQKTFSLFWGLIKFNY